MEKIVLRKLPGNRGTERNYTSFQKIYCNFLTFQFFHYKQYSKYVYNDIGFPLFTLSISNIDYEKGF